MAKTGRPKITVNWDKFETACSLMATKEEICSLLDIKDQTLQRRIKEKYNDTFEGVLKKLSGECKLSLRRHQFALAEKNATMAIWLGKQYLGQSDEGIKSIELVESKLSMIAKAIRAGDAN